MLLSVIHARKKTKKSRFPADLLDLNQHTLRKGLFEYKTVRKKTTLVKSSSFCDSDWGRVFSYKAKVLVFWDKYSPLGTLGFKIGLSIWPGWRQSDRQT